MASTSAAQPTPLPQPLRYTRGDLSIKVGESWLRLASPEGDAKFNCYSVVFDDGVTVTQVNRRTGGTCSVKLTLETPATILKDEGNPRKGLSVEGKCIEIGEPVIDSSNTDKALGIEDAKTFALADLDPTITVIKLAGLMISNTKKKNLTEEAIRQEIETLLVSKAGGNATNDAGVFVRELVAMSMAERDEQAQKIMKQTGCRVQVLKDARGAQLELRAWPSVDPSARNIDILTNDMPMRFVVVGHPLLIKDELPTHPIIGQETDEWEINVIKSSAAPIVGIISNSFPQPEDMDNFISEVLGITLEPIIDGVLGTWVRKAMRELETTSADQEGLDVGQISMYFDPNKALSALPLESLFLVGKPVPATKDLVITIPSPPPAGWNRGLKERQATAVQGSVTNKLFAVHGPPGTGKSQVASRILWCLLSLFEGSKVLCSAPANEAVESLLQRCVKECKTLGMQETPFVRLWSVSQTKAQYSNGEYAVLDDPYHIEALRLNMARRNASRFAAYLQGHETLRKFGVIANVKLHQEWNQTTTILTRMVMNEARGAFCTTAALGSTALKWKAQGETRTWPADTWLLDEAGQANPDEVLLGLVTFANTLKRFIMFGSQLQLPAFKGSNQAKKFYRKSFLMQFLDRGFPYVLLNHQFRALDLCMWPVNKIVYGGQLSAEFRRDHPGPLGPALLRLQTMLPLSFFAGNTQYKTTALHNFVDVADGQHFVPEGGFSPGNHKEVPVVSALVKCLQSGGIESSQICVLSAYRTQVHLLRQEATQAQWQDCFINTIDKSQGQEFLVVIISLVKTEGFAGFVEEVGRACVACSRHRVALYFVGNWIYWRSKRTLGLHALTDIIMQMKWKSGPLRDMPEFVVDGTSLPSASQPHITFPPRPQPASRKPDPPPVPQSSKEDEKEEKQRQRVFWRRKWEQLKVQRDKDVGAKMAVLALQKAAALAAVEAEYESIKDNWLRQLPINAEIEEAEEALSRLS